MKPNKRIPLCVGASSALTWFMRETEAQSKVFEPSLGLLGPKPCGFLPAYWKVPPTLHVLSMAWRSVRGFCWCSIESFRYSFPASSQVRSHSYKEAVYTAGTVLQAHCNWIYITVFQSAYSCSLFYFSTLAQSDTEVHRSAENWDLYYSSRYEPFSQQNARHCWRLQRVFSLHIDFGCGSH